MSPAWFQEQYDAESIAATLSSATWTVVEVNTGIIFACLPMMKGPFTHLIALGRAWRTQARDRSVELELAPFRQGRTRVALPSVPTDEPALPPMVRRVSRPGNSPATLVPPLPAPASLTALPQMPQPALQPGGFICFESSR